MSMTLKTDVFEPQIFTDTVQGRLADSNALMRSVFTASGAILVEGTFPGRGREVIGQEVLVPYFGTLGGFVDNPDGSAITPQKIAMTTEKAAVTRDSLAFQASVWARASASKDPYGEMAEQAEEQAERRIQDRIVAAAATSPLLVDLTSQPDDMLTYDAIVWAMAEAYGEEDEDAVAIASHPLALAGLATQRDSTGNLILTTAQEGRVPRLYGMPLVKSARMPKTGSVMGTVTGTGTTPPAVTLSGTPLDAFKKVVLDLQLGGARGVATFRFSTDGGNTWSADFTTAASVELTDTAIDSLVGKNGATGLTANFADATYNADNVYTSIVNFVVETHIYMKGAGVFWYNRDALGMKSDEDILDDSFIAAMHLYGVPHIYRRRHRGTKPGVLRIRHKVRGYRGV